MNKKMGYKLGVSFTIDPHIEEHCDIDETVSKHQFLKNRLVEYVNKNPQMMDQWIDKLKTKLVELDGLDLNIKITKFLNLAEFTTFDSYEIDK